MNYWCFKLLCYLIAEAQLGGGRPGARPPLAHEKGGGAQLHSKYCCSVSLKGRIQDLSEGGQDF